jgi:hypothetical protein
MRSESKVSGRKYNVAVPQSRARALTIFRAFDPHDARATNPGGRCRTRLIREAIRGVISKSPHRTKRPSLLIRRRFSHDSTKYFTDTSLRKKVPERFHFQSRIDPLAKLRALDIR